MGIYQSQVVVYNNTDSEQTAGEVTFSPRSSITVWETSSTGINAVVFNAFERFSRSKAEVDGLVQSGVLDVIQDGMTLTYDQYLHIFEQMRGAVESAADLNQLLIPLRSQPVQQDGVPLVAQAPRQGNEWVIGTHNFCDPCTWFGDSVRVNDEILLDSGDGLTFTSSHINWIDMISGRVHGESTWVSLQMSRDSDPHGYQVVVKVDGVEKVMREPFETSGGDYEVIWDDGKTVTASYSYATTNVFHISPQQPGRILVVEDAETDISIDVVMSDEIIYHGFYFDGSGWQPADAGFGYKRVGQLVTEARGCYPNFQAIGASSQDKDISDIKEFRRKSRGLKHPRQSCPFNYTTARHIPYGAELRVYTRYGRPMEGESVTMTFFCTEVDQ